MACCAEGYTENAEACIIFWEPAASHAAPAPQQVLGTAPIPDSSDNDSLGGSGRAAQRGAHRSRLGVEASGGIGLQGRLLPAGASAPGCGGPGVLPGTAPGTVYQGAASGAVPSSTLGLDGAEPRSNPSIGAGQPLSALAARRPPGARSRLGSGGGDAAASPPAPAVGQAAQPAQLALASGAPPPELAQLPSQQQQQQQLARPASRLGGGSFMPITGSEGLGGSKRAASSLSGGGDSFLGHAAGGVSELAFWPYIPAQPLQRLAC